MPKVDYRACKEGVLSVLKALTVDDFVERNELSGSGFNENRYRVKLSQNSLKGSIENNFVKKKRPIEYFVSLLYGVTESKVAQCYGWT